MQGRRRGLAGGGCERICSSALACPATRTGGCDWLAGTKIATLSGRVLTAAAMNAHNTFDQPENVKPAPFTGVTLSADGFTATLPAKSVAVLELQ